MKTTKTNATSDHLFYLLQNEHCQIYNEHAITFSSNQLQSQNRAEIQAQSLLPFPEHPAHYPACDPR